MSKVAVVVGVGPGIGAAVARRFAKEGFKLGLIARSQNNLTPTQSDIEKAGGVAFSVTADASSEQSLKKAIQDVQSKLGEISVLVYNAAVLERVPGVDLVADHLVDTFKVNVVGALVAAQTVFPSMNEKKNGTILFTGGGFSIKAYPGFASLAIGKSGIRSLGQALGAEWKENGIHVASVAVCGIVKPDDPKYNPDLIAEEYWKLHQQQAADWVDEVVY